MAVHTINETTVYKSSFDRLVDALSENECCTIGEITTFNSTRVATSSNSFHVKMSHRKHNHGEIMDAIIRIKLSETENLLGQHVDAFVQIANMEYIYKDCTFSINTI